MKKNKLGVIVTTGLILVCSSTGWATLWTPPTEGLVGYWSFDDQANPGQDDSGNGNDGTVYGTTWTTGKFGGALSFDGLDDYIEVSDDSSLEPQNVTVAAWVYRKGVTTRDTILQKGTTAYVDGRNGYFFRIAKFSDGVPNKSQFYIVVENNSNQIAPPSDTAIEQNQWYHIAATYDGSKIRMYVNGIEEGVPTSQTRPIDYTGGQQSFKIGVAEAGYGTFQNYFYGMIDDVRVYNRALSASEIKALVPEPATLLLLGLGGLLLRRRKQ